MVSRREDVARVEVLVDAFPSVDPSRVEASVARLGGKLGKAGLDITRLRAEQLSIPSVLTACNEVLDPMALELKEYEPGKFSLGARSPESIDCSDMSVTEDDAMDGALLSSWLLRIRGCISVLDFGIESAEDPLASVLRTVLDECGSLKTISLRYWDLSHQEMEEFIRALSFLSNVENFLLHSCIISDVSASNIARMLENSRSCMKSMHVGSGGFQPSGFASLITALSHCGNITSLVLSCWLVELDSVKLLAEYLKSTVCLRELKVPDIQKEACAEAILDAMRSNVSIRKLEIPLDNCASSQVAYPIADMIKVNSVLESLSIESRGIDSLGASAVADSLRTNSTLNELGFLCDRIGSQGAMAFAEALKLNKTLQKLQFGFSRMNCAVLKAFVLTLSQNSSLAMVHLSDIDMNREEKGRLRTILTLSGACKRLSTSWNDVGLSRLAADIKSNAMKEVYVDFDVDTRVNVLGDVFDAVQRCSHVTHLCIVKVGELPKSSIANLALALVHSKTLKTVELRCEYRYDLLKLVSVIDALKFNASITRMDFGDFDVEDYGEEAKHLAEALRVNRTLHWVMFKTGVLTDRDLEGIAEAMSTNEVLVELVLGDCMSRSKGLFDIRERLRRNQLMLNRAVEFVLKTSVDEDESKGAFGKLYRKDSLVEMVKTVAHLTDLEAREVIEDAAASLLRETVVAVAV
ncbi:unnamed protein product [Ixodes hexagonus]